MQLCRDTADQDSIHASIEIPDNDTTRRRDVFQGLFLSSLLRALAAFGGVGLSLTGLGLWMAWHSFRTGNVLIFFGVMTIVLILVVSPLDYAMNRTRSGEARLRGKVSRLQLTDQAIGLIYPTAEGYSTWIPVESIQSAHLRGWSRYKLFLRLRPGSGSWLDSGQKVLDVTYYDKEKLCALVRALNDMVKQHQ